MDNDCKIKSVTQNQNYSQLIHSFYSRIFLASFLLQNFAIAAKFVSIYDASRVSNHCTYIASSAGYL